MTEIRPHTEAQSTPKPQRRILRLILTTDIKRALEGMALSTFQRFNASTFQHFNSL